MLELARWFKSEGLLDLGYNYMNFDDCIVSGRDPVTHALIPDPQAFPKGPRYVSDQLSALGFSMGWYSVRGNFTCASIKPYYPQRPGSNNHEALDAASYVEWGVKYLKYDTCVGPNVPYNVMGHALNATGVPIFYSLCEPGQGPVTAPVGRATGNGWRINMDDGGLWIPILDNVNMNAPLYPYSGCDEQHHNDGLGCGYNDMGLLMIGTGVMSPDQDESHIALWAIMANKLLISVDPRTFSPHALALVKNTELLAIDQDGAKLQGRRFSPPPNATRSAADAARIAAWKAAHLEGGSWRAAGRSGELLAHAEAGAVPGTEEAEVLAGGGRGEVWQRQLVPGQGWALLLFNNGMPGSPSVIECRGACWAAMGFGATQTVHVRDVLARSDNGTAVGGYAAPVRTNGTVLVRLY